MKPIIAVPVTAALVYRAWSRKSLTPLGIGVAVLTAVAHAVHPWSVFFVQLVVFFLAGTAATKVKHDIKARLTHSSGGGAGGEGPRTHVQVLANSIVASVLVLLHAWSLYSRAGEGGEEQMCFPRGGSAAFRLADLAVVGAVVNYAATASDTLSSELGILSTRTPRLILPPHAPVPRGTNGGVTSAGLVAGLAGSTLLSLTASLLLPFCPRSPAPAAGESGWDAQGRVRFTVGVALAGFAGTLLDSLLGATLQASVVDVRSRKIVEGDGGRRVPVTRGASSSSSSSSSSPSPSSAANSSSVDVVADVKARAGTIAPGGSAASGGGGGGAAATTTTTTATDGRQHQHQHQHGLGESRRIVTGRDWLSNNGVNVLMAGLTSAGAMGVAGVLWRVFV